jgi:choline dehydrogenase-like flavoprotein
VTRVIIEGGRAVGVVARTEDGHVLTVRARAVVVACGALVTPIFLERQGLAGSSGQLGKNLSIHPAGGALAEFDEVILPWKGIPQGYAIEDLHEEGILYEGANVPLEMTMTMTALVGPDQVMGQPMVRYWLTEQDVSHVKRALDVLAQVFVAAGARRVHLPIAGFDVIESPDGLAALRRARIRPWDFDLSAYHPLGTARMGTDPASSVVGPDHRVHDTEGLYIVDGSVVPSSLGVNPQITIMALATRAAEKIAGALVDR